MSITVVLCPDCTYEARADTAQAASVIWATHYLNTHTTDHGARRRRSS